MNYKQSVRDSWCFSHSSTSPPPLPVSRDRGQHLTNERRLEEGLGAAEALIANGDDLPIWQLIALLQRGRGGCRGHLVLEVQGHIAQLLLDVSHDFSLG